MDDLVVQDNEDYTIPQEEFIQGAESQQETTAEIIVLTPQDIDISEAFFVGARMSVIMCMLSLGMWVVIGIFKKSM